MRLGVAFSIVIRTKFLDDLLRQASASGVRQVVLLGAGMDSRAFRMDWPEGTRLFEVDTAAPLEFKASVLRQERAVAHCERITVAVDLREDWPGALAAAGHDPAVPTVWIAEGLLIYLPEDAVELLLARISAQSAAGSRMGLTLGSRGVIERFGADTVPGSCGLHVGFGDARRPGGLAGRARLGGLQPHPARARCRLRTPDQHPAAARGAARRTDLGGPPVSATPATDQQRVLDGGAVLMDVPAVGTGRLGYQWSWRSQCSSCSWRLILVRSVAVWVVVSPPPVAVAVFVTWS